VAKLIKLTRAAGKQTRIAETQRLSTQPIGRLMSLTVSLKRRKDRLYRLPKELVTPSSLEQQAAMFSNLGDVLAIFRR
jgi:hypothetical protein